MAQDGPLPTSRDPVSLADLLDGGSHEFQIDEDDVNFNRNDAEMRADKVFAMDSLLEQINLDCLSTSDPSTTPFEELEKKMNDIWVGGLVKKRILRDGTIKIPDYATIRLHYNLFTEMEEVPFDSTYLRSPHPTRFKLGDGSLFVGFEIAVSSMTVGEKAQFLIHPDLAFGELGSPGRISGNATIMLIAEVFRIDNTAEEVPLSIQERNKFETVYKKAKLMNQEANKLFLDNNTFRAISVYSKAENALLRCSLSNDQEEEKLKHLLLKIYGNLAVCYNSPGVNQPRKVCIAVNRAFDIDSKNASKNPKLLYNRGVAYMALSEYRLAKRDLKLASNLSPGNNDIKQQMGILENRIESYKAFQKESAVKALGFKNVHENVSSSLVGTAELCKTDLKIEELASAVK